MGERAKRPLNQDAVSAADDSLYNGHAGDPRPNALFDAAGNRKPLDANDPDQAGLRQEWMEAYKANGGETEPNSADGHTPADQPVMPCDQRPVVNPVIMAAPTSLDESDDGSEPPQPEDAADEPEPEDSAPEEEATGADEEADGTAAEDAEPV
jgi:hypothetical protein